MGNTNEIKQFLLNRFHSCLDTAMKFDLKIKDHYRICGNCEHPNKHPCSCGGIQKLKNLEDMLEE